LRSFCISHAKDVDGLTSAALVVAARNALFRVTDYDDLLDELDAIPKAVDELILCDLGTDPGKFPKFSAKIGELSARMSVTYIDHHYLTPQAKLELKKLGVRVVHNPGECAGMLTYRTFRESLPEGAKQLALYAAVTDYMDNSPLSKKLMQRFDRHFILLEATLLSYAVARRGSDPRFLENVVRSLSKMELPHKIPGVPRYALQQLEVVESLAEVVRQTGKLLGRVAFAETKEHATGNVAKLLLGAFDVPVAVAFREKDRKGWVEVSLRGTPETRVHLGQTISRLAENFGGNGGGHRLAAGCSVPREHILQLIEELGSLV
jgi:RecJ-like exonuclease